MPPKNITPGRRWRNSRRHYEYLPPRPPSSPNEEDSFDYEAERLRWASMLNTMDLRALATDYYRGIDTTEVGRDAYEEFCRRHPYAKLRKASRPKDSLDDLDPDMIDDEGMPLTGDLGVMQTASEQH